MTFPSQVNVQPAPAVEGDIASTNPRVSVMNQAGAFIAAAIGVLVGRFAWADVATNTTLSNSGAGAPTGFVAREQQAYITQFLAEGTMTIPQGRPVTAFSEGDFWVKNNGSAASAIGQKAYANNADGSISFAATASPPSSASVLGANSAIAANSVTATLSVPSVTGSIAGTVLTVSAVGTGGLAPGKTIAGTGVDPATTIVAQLTGTAGSTGTYQVSVSQTVASTTITASGGWMNVTAVSTGTLIAGQTVTGTGIPAGTVIDALATGTGGTGTYSISTAPTPGAGVTVTGAGSTWTVSTAITGAIKLNDTITGTSVPAGTYISAFLTGTGGLGTYMLSKDASAGTGNAIAVPSATETKWYAASVGAVGELVKMTSWPQG